MTKKVGGEVLNGGGDPMRFFFPGLVGKKKPPDSDWRPISLEL